MKKTKIMIIALIGAIVSFVILTVIQGAILKKETFCEAIMLTRSIDRNAKITDRDIEMVKLPLEIVVKGKLLMKVDEVNGKFAARELMKGQLLIAGDVGTKEELKFVEAPIGLEKIAIKIGESQNGLSYQIRPKDRVHLYFTGRYSSIKNVVQLLGLPGIENENSIYTFKLLENLEILGVYDRTGNAIDSAGFSGVDTILVAVDSERAAIINNIRVLGTFDLTA